MGRQEALQQPNYSLDDQGVFVIENYHNSKPFSNFFPGIAGTWGIPMWVFYVNRGQCIASFGIESKDKSILEFQPANKAYRLTSTQGFRTFIKATSSKGTSYWEPFQNHLPGTDFNKNTRMAMTAYDLTLVEVNHDLGLVAEVNYFTLPEEPYAALVRRLTVRNISKRKYSIELLDGLPTILAYGMGDGLVKNISRTIEAWIKVRNIRKKAPFYQLNVEVSDKPEVTHIREGNFFFSYDPALKGSKLLNPCVEAAAVFGSSTDFTAPECFRRKEFKIPAIQETSNRTPCAMAHHQYDLPGGEAREIVSLFGYAQSVERLQTVVKAATRKGYLDRKAADNRLLIEQIKSLAFTNSSSGELNLYTEHTFLDNILRGGLPISIHTGDGNVAFNVYSRKHGDLERDYNYFFVAPTFYSQGNGNYRDVNQNRRNDVWFNTDVRDSHLVTFLNLVQADGYNPLVVKGASFTITDAKDRELLINKTVVKEHQEGIEVFLTTSFQPGELLKFIIDHDVELKVDIRDFLGMVLEVSHKQEQADHGEGFWTDHWTYNLDLMESYLALYPEALEDLLINRRDFTFYWNHHYVLPRDQRYILTKNGVRQYASVHDASKEIPNDRKGYRLRTRDGEGEVYHTSLVNKLLCLIANKTATFDPSGVGIEMEADKPNWYDALNGLPGLLGSSLSEMFELKRYARFLLDSLTAVMEEKQDVPVYQELADFIEGLTPVLSEKNDLAYWNRSNDLKEDYRRSVRMGLSGVERDVPFELIQRFLTGVIEKTRRAEAAARTADGFLPTYFYHQVTEHEVIEKGEGGKKTHVRPLAFQRHDLPLFLEGYVHAMRADENSSEALAYYQQVRKSSLYDKKLKMYKVNSNLASETEEIGRCRIFPSGWLENESIWLHMEYKFILEIIRNGLYEEFYENFRNVLVPFQPADRYGRSVLENSSFIVSSAHEDPTLHGQGFVARLSGSTAEFIHIWLLMNLGPRPFRINDEGDLELVFQPALAGWLFTENPSNISYHIHDDHYQTDLPADTYAFMFLGHTLVVYHNPERKSTFGSSAVKPSRMELSYAGVKKPVLIDGGIVDDAHARAVRDRQVERIDIFLQ